MHRRILALGAIALAATLTISGCGGASSSGPSAGSDATIVVASMEPDHLTPGRQAGAFDPVMTIFAPLVAVDDKGDLTYAQAESVTSDDSQHWTITLRKGWTFHNGEPVTAESYVTAWNYTAYGPNVWENSWQLAAIEGYGDLNPAEGTPSTESLSGLKVVDDYTFTVTLVGPDSQFPLQLTGAQTGFYPMPKAAYKDLEAYDRQPIGNGAFKMDKAWEADREITMVRYNDFKGQKPTVGAITFRPYTSMDTAYIDALAGNTDIVFLPASKMTSAAADFGQRLYSFEAPGVDFLGFPLNDPRYSNVKLRQAISMSIDREAINKAIFGGLHKPSTSLTAPIMAGNPDGICGKYCTFDPAGAKALLAEAGGFSGPMEIIYPGSSGLDDLYEAYANQIRQNLGIEGAIAVPTTDWAAYYDRLLNGTLNGPHQGHWGALYSSQQNTLRSVYTAQGGCSICTGYSSPLVDDLLTKADAAPTLDESYGYYKKAQEEILKDFPTVPTFSNQYSYVTSEKINSLVAVSGSPVYGQTVVNGK